MEDVVTIFSKSVELRNSWSQLVDHLEQHSSGAIDLQLKTHNNVSIRGINDTVLLVCETILGLQSNEQYVESSSFLLLNYGQLKNGLQSGINASSSLFSELMERTRDAETNIFLLNETCTFEFRSKEEVLDSYIAENNINIMISGLSTVVNSLGPLLVFVRSTSGADLTDRANAMRSLVAETGKFEKQARDTVNEINQLKKTASKAQQSINEKLSEAVTNATSIQTLQNQATADSSSVTTLISSIKATNAEALKLETTVKNYKAEFEEYQSEMDARNESYDLLIEKNKQASKDLNEQLIEIQRLTQLSDSMLTGATTAGLSSSLEEARKRYESRMKGARIGFLWSIGGLALASVATMVIWYNLHAVNTQASTLISWPEVFRGLALLLPASWLTAFFARSYAHYFQLEREYAHKAALAMAIDGFKKQAPKYEEEITAEVFMEVRKNPTSSKDVDPVRHPWHDILIRIFPIRRSTTKHVDKGDASNN